MKFLGIVQKAEKDPQDCIFGNSCKRQKMIPRDVLEEKRGQTIQSKSIDEDINLGETSDICGQDKQPCCVGSDCHLVVHL